MKRGILALLGVCLAAGCGGGMQQPAPAEPDPDLVSRQRVEAALDEALRRVGVLTDSLDALLRPVPLLTPAQEGVFRRYSNAQQLERARALGVRPASPAGLEEYRRAGRLLVLEDSTSRWVVRRLEHSEPFVTPDARALLAEIGDRFHDRLAGLGLPPFRLEVTSVMRTAGSQEALRRVNPNAALGESTHEYGTTLDVAYASFAAPADPGVDFGLGDVAWLEPRLAGIAAAMLETVAARNSRELQAILGGVMAEVQAEGLAMVTLERLQPVYHFTVARRLAGVD
jgi:hypothetical protein